MYHPSQILTRSPWSTDHGPALPSSLVKALLVGFPPMLLYVSTAAGFAHWLDSGEFVAAAADFGISHPPGHPLASIVLGAANLIPVGALAFRISLVCSLLGTAAAISLFFAIELTLDAGNVVRASLRFPLAVAGTWWIVATHAWWFQAVRPEVYALQAALLAFALERLLRATVPSERPDPRPLYQAALALGLALANHHFLALLAVVPASWLLLGIWRSWGWRPFGWSAGFVAAGLLTYLYLPLRALRGPYLNLGDPSTPGRFIWTVTAEAFQKSIAPGTAAPFGETLADVLIAMGQDLHVVTLAASLLGAYFMLRVKSTRKYGLFWLTLWLVLVVGRASLGFVRGNPDALGYVMLSYGCVASFAAFALGVVLSSLAEAIPSRPRLTPALATVIALAASFQCLRSLQASSLAGFIDTDVFDDGLRRSLPARSVVFVHNPQTIFRYWGGEAEESNRPDVTMIPLPLLTYPKLVDRMARDEPELMPLLRSYVLAGRLSSSDMQALAALRPVYVEMDPRIGRPMMEWLVPEHLYHRVLSDDVVDIDEGRAAERHAILWNDIYARLGRPLDEQTVTQLLWRHYTDSLYFVGIGDVKSARRTVAAGLALNPLAQQLVRMQEALSEASQGERIKLKAFKVE